MENNKLTFLLRCFGVLLSPIMISYTVHHVLINNYANATLGIVMFVFALWLTFHEE